MRIFLDANILVSVLNKEYPVFSYSARVLSMASTKNFDLFTSPICLAIAFYFAEKKYNSPIAKAKIELLCDHISIAPSTHETVVDALRNPAVNDFEDGLEYYSAIGSNCDLIVTEDASDLYFADIEVLNSENFCRKYLN